MGAVVFIKPLVMRLWRTGACELLYDSKVDDEAFVTCEMYAGIVITYTIIFLNAGDVTGL